MSELFTLQIELPDPRDQIPLYRTVNVRSYSRRNEKLMGEIQRRSRRYAEYFGLEGEPQDFGDRFAYLTDHASLEIYVPSDSSWWTNRDLAYSEDPRLGENPPSAEEARKIADRLIDELDERQEGLVYRDLEPLLAAVSESPESEPRSYQTGVVVDYRYELAELPIFGPGAKLQVSIAGGSQLSEFLVFWRKPKEVGTIPVIHPYQAFERFMRDARFAHLQPGAAKVSIYEFRLGFYAMGPSVFQRYLVPAYSVKAQVATEAHPEDEVKVYVVATDIEEERLKQAGLRARPHVSYVFSG